MPLTLNLNQYNILTTHTAYVISRIFLLFPPPHPADFVHGLLYDRLLTKALRLCCCNTSKKADSLQLLYRIFSISCYEQAVVSID
jgi:hypothetical protein